MKFDRNLPAKIVLIGAGGTGGHIATHLYRLLYALNREVRLIVCDGDIVEEKNLVRQNFAPADLGVNKAKVIAERYSSVFGLECEYIPDFIENEARLTELLEPRTWMNYVKGRRGLNQKVFVETVILIGAVDNDKSRKMCHRVFKKAANLIYIDSGNGERTGQVVCGIRNNGQTVYEPVAQLHPEILKRRGKFPTELSCAAASVSAPQSIMANVMAATTVLCIVYNILAEGENEVHCAYFSSRLSSVQSHLEEKPKAIITVLETAPGKEPKEGGEVAA